MVDVPHCTRYTARKGLAEQYTGFTLCYVNTHPQPAHYHVVCYARAIVSALGHASYRQSEKYTANISIKRTRKKNCEQ